MKHRPFLKWAGNKYPLLDRILAVLPKGRRLVEPFVGAGSVFLNSPHSRFLLADSNSDLIALFNRLKLEGDEFIEYCRTLFTPDANDKQVFYERRKVFNATPDSPQRSALFVYLNRHGYNGLCRYNSKHIFNTPFGSYKKVYFPEAELRVFRERSSEAEFHRTDFVQAMQNAEKGDVVYCDPPYVPLSSTSNFTSYGGSSVFNSSQQEMLAELALSLSARGIPVLLSNHDTPSTRKIYQRAQILSFEVRRSISCKADRRGKVQELLALFHP